MRKTIFRIVSLAVILLSAVHVAATCPVCYGSTETSSPEGMSIAILTLLGITGGVLSGVVAFALHMRKRSKITLNGDVDLPSVN